MKIQYCISANDKNMYETIHLVLKNKLLISNHLLTKLIENNCIFLNNSICDTRNSFKENDILIVNFDYLEDNTNIIVVDNTTLSYELLEENIKTFSDENNITIEKSTENIEELEKTIEDNELIVILNSDTNKYLKAEIISNNKIDNLTYQLILQALNNTKTTIGMLASNIDPNILQNIQQNIEVERTILNEELSTDENTDLIMSSVFPTLILPFFMLIIFLVQMVGGEICEEKTTRSMEIIISNVSPKMHLMSKILASNLFVIIQGLLLVVYAIIAFIISKYLGNSLLNASINISTIIDTLKSSGMFDKLIFIIPITLILIIASFVAYSLVAGILASMTVNIEDFNQLQTPIMLISLAGYYLSIMASMFDGSILIRILSYIPFLSVFISPTLFVIGQVTVIDMLISVLVLIAFIFILLKYGLRVYKVGILNYSSNKIWSRLFKAFKSKEN